MKGVSMNVNVVIDNLDLFKKKVDELASLLCQVTDVLEEIDAIEMIVNVKGKSS